MKTTPRCYQLPVIILACARMRQTDVKVVSALIFVENIFIFFFYFLLSVRISTRIVLESKSLRFPYDTRPVRL